MVFSSIFFPTLRDLLRGQNTSTHTSSPPLKIVPSGLPKVPDIIVGCDQKEAAGGEAGRSGVERRSGISLRKENLVQAARMERCQSLGRGVYP